MIFPTAWNGACLLGAVDPPAANETAPAEGTATVVVPPPLPVTADGSSSGAVIQIAYLIASACFILGLKWLAHPRTAVRANYVGAAGMLLAVAATLAAGGVSLGVVFAGIAVGTAIGVPLALRVPMTSMPQMVALLNGLGGLASVIVGGAAFLLEAPGSRPMPDYPFGISVGLSGLIGAVTFTGSAIAYAKLQELMPSGSIFLPQRHAINLALAAASLLLTAALCFLEPTGAWAPVAFWTLSILCCVLGVLLVLPIGGADMPVVIALLNSYSGLAAAATGFVVRSDVLIIAGSLVGASGVILTQIMCKAMNRSLVNVLFGTVGGGAAGSGPKADDVYAGKVKSAGPDEIALILDGARRVVIVPGYGLAVAQAQHQVRLLADELERRGAEVEFGIHPVAGRMPGHMNVLLAEAEIPYEKLLEMDAINPTFARTDVVIVIGANDVVNPAARNDPGSPIAGMPILNVDEARTVIVVKRSLSPGFAGIPNPLFANDNTLLFFSDGKQALNSLLEALKSV